MKILCNYVLIIGLLVVSNLPGQSYFFKNYNVKDGLIQSNVKCIEFDSLGYAWLGTESGLSKFDGVRFKNFSTEDGLFNNSIADIITDKKGRAWIAHESGGVTVFENGQFKPLKLPSVSNAKILFLYEDADGKIWISLASKGIIVCNNVFEDIYNSSNYTMYSSNDGLGSKISSMVQDKQHTLWFVTEYGVKYKLRGASKFDAFTSSELPMLYPSQITIDNQNNLFIGYYSTSASILVKYSVDKQEFSYFATPSWVSSIYVAKNNDVWVSAWGKGAMRIRNNKTTYFNSSNGLPDNKVYCFNEDREGNIFSGILGQGLTIFKGDYFLGHALVPSVQQKPIKSITCDTGSTIWVSTTADVYELNTRNDSVVPLRFLNPTGNSIVALKVYENLLWILFSNDLKSYDLKTNKVISYGAISSDLKDLIATSFDFDRERNLWLGTNEGVIKYNFKTNTLQNYRVTDGIPGNDIKFIYFDKKGKLWVACKGKGLCYFEGRKFIVSKKFENTDPTCITEDSNCIIWIGTQNNGLFRVENESNVKSLKAKDGLLSDNIVALVSYNEKIYIGTNKGLDVLDVITNRVRSFGQSDGLTGIEVSPNALVENSAQIFIGTVDGLMSFNPEYFKKGLVAPTIVVNDFLVNDSSRAISSQYLLSHNEDNIAINVQGICYSNPDKLSYFIQIEGNEDTSWHTIPTPTHFQPLIHNPGKYVLNIKVLNADGLFSDIRKIHITIEPPFWETWWFLGTISLVIIISYPTVLKLNSRRLRKKNLDLEKKVQERTAEVVLKNKELDEKNKDITASIRYAKRIQDAILPPDSLVSSALPEAFILYKPKDIVSGDFYWIYEKDDCVFFAAVDCTGHGVPGAFMSIVGHNLLDKLVGENELLKPSEILDALNKSVSDTLRQSSRDDQVKDGMDITLCSYNKKTNELQFAGAYNPLWMVTNSADFVEIKADKFPIGTLSLGEQKQFTNNNISLQKGDTIYIFSDGFADQFGGPLGKKYKYGTLKKLLLSIQSKSMQQQKEILLTEFLNWQGNQEQVDDVLIIGIRF
ncbi:MAG: SpoIIE family protein phosphatase [Bacteroidetes bacterium]|nr:SpoIIE family protein phosphatase [Bacteroidota bacterium]